MTADLRALVICEQAFQQAENGAWHIIGVHDHVFVPALPAVHTPFVVWFQVHRFTGEKHVTATIRDSEDAVLKAVRAMVPKLPSGSLEFAFAFPPLTFAREGTYALELHVGDEVVGLRSFRVRVVPPRTE